MKFVPHNIPASNIQKSTFTAFGKVTDRRMRSKGYTSEAMLFVFSGASALTSHPARALGA